MQATSKLKPQDIPRLYKKHKSLRAIERATGETYAIVQRRYAHAVQLGLMDHVAMGAKSTEALKNPKTRQRVKALRTKRTRHSSYILTCAQNNTNVHMPAWANLKALAQHDDAKIFVSTFLYSKRGLGARNDKASLDRKGAPKRDQDEMWFDPQVVPYINNDRVEIAKGIVWCGELNILPTASRPLSGLEVYTGRASMVVPHTKIAMQSIATIGGTGTKLNFSTGTVTLRNYIQRKEGFKSEFHHCYGALLVEVDDEGHWWARQLNADSDGIIYDLDRKVKDGIVTEGNRVEAIVMGDVHVANIDKTVAASTWGEGGMVDVLRPKYQFIHDVLDMHARNHHIKKDPYKGFKRFVQKKDDVEAEVLGVYEFLRNIIRDDCETIIVNSNHDRHLGRWLAETDARFDPVNAQYWSKLNSRMMDYIAADDGNEPDVLYLALSMINADFEEDLSVKVLGSAESFVVCPKFGNGIECGLHFDVGPNGARGALRSFAKSIGRRTSGGHSHVAGITDGAYQAGTNSVLDLEYNRCGPSAWTHSDIITYANGKRAICTFFDGKWRA